MAAALSQHLQRRFSRSNATLCRNAWACRCRRIPRRTLTHVPVHSPSKPNKRHIHVWQDGSDGRLGSYDAELVSHAPHPHHPLKHDGAGSGPRQHGGLDDGWRWQEPVVDASLSSADRAVLALVRAAANLSDKLTAERAAAAHGLALVTNSDVCVAPLLPPFGFTMEDDGEEGDGMALSPPLHLAAQPAGRPAAGATSLWERGGASAAGASALFSSAAAAVAGARGAAAASRGGGAQSGSAGGTPWRGGGAAAGAASAHSDEELRMLARLVAEGAGVDSDDGEGEEVFQGFAAGGSRGQAAAGAAGLLGAAAAALGRVARAAVPSPMGQAAAGAAHAAAHAAQAAVATAARATVQILPHHGDPTSSWLVADDPHGGVRFIIIAAGPDLRRRTARELTVDLVTFESYNLGVKVNRRLYEEAKALYARFMPLVMDFLEAVPDGNICFGGQGVGGSLAVLLQLMCVHRGLRFARLLPAVAVDSPAVLGQVPLQQRRVWGSAGWEQQRHQPQDPLEDVLEDLMQRTVLEELGLPHDAVRNLVLPPAAPPTRAQHQQPPYSVLASSTEASPLVMLAVEGASGGGAAAGSGGLDGAPRAQVFRQVGRLVHVETIGSLNNKVVSGLRPSSSQDAAVVSGSVAAYSSNASVDIISVADGGSGEPAAVAAAAAAGLGASHKRLDAATMGSIATAAATAAASAAVERLRFVGAGALRAMVPHKGGAAAAAAAASVRAPVPGYAVAPRAAVAAAGSPGQTGTSLRSQPFKQHASWPSAVEAEAGRHEEGQEEDDASAWGV